MQQFPLDPSKLILITCTVFVTDSLAECSKQTIIWERGAHLRAVGTSKMPDRAAKAAAMALWGSALASTALAAGMKKDLTSGSMLSRRRITCLAEAAMTSTGPGGPTICRLGTCSPNQVKSHCWWGVHQSAAVRRVAACEGLQGCF